MHKNPDDQKLAELLRQSKTIAVVGLSDDPAKASNQVAQYLQSQGYEIVPVNPNATTVLGRKAHASLLDVEEPVDIVDVFRRSEQIPEVVDQVLQMRQKPKAVWIQLGIVNNEQCKRIEEAGIMAIQDSCIKVEHNRLLEQ
ncbi:CoA-binding protein [Effusibacillus pohliae]|uniref:CoA-binding protein n=1 Tax=Effusibacillus pohliae TaxID=232270 RepID=UPI0003729CDA|nr:CoA-binding protein [Effusibacillus pohliae]